MSGIVLSASVRQNLLSLQSTADLLATTQNRLATGKKVNTALDNPTNFFTAQSLDARAGDINNLLDGIGNGVQVLQAANIGITSLQKLVDTAKSLANQALQSAVGYSTKSNVSRDDRRRHRDRPARHHDLHQRDRALQRAVLRRGRRRHGGDLHHHARRHGGNHGRRSTDTDIRHAAIYCGHLLNDARTGPWHRCRPAARRRQQLHRQRQDHHLQGGRGWPGGAVPSRLWHRCRAASVATDGNGNSIIYLGASATTSTATVGDVLTRDRHRQRRADRR